MQTNLCYLIRLLTSAGLLLGVIACPGPPDESHDEATHVFVGKVKELDVARGDGTDFYNVKISVETVEKGEGIKPSDDVVVNCYVTHPVLSLNTATPKQRWLKPGGPINKSYSGIPKENQKIKVYARKVNESYKGVYPNWYDIVTP